MSKSTNHFVAIKDFLTKYPSEVLRLVFLSVSYAQPLDFTFEVTTENLKKLAKIYRFVSLVDSYSNYNNENNNNEFNEQIFADLNFLVSKMRAFLADDLNSSAALAVFFDFIRNVNSKLNVLEKSGKTLSKDDNQLLKTKWPEFKSWIKNGMGLLVEEPNIFFQNLRKYNLASEISASEIEQKIEERKKARSNKDWAKGDAIRDELLTHGVQIQDAPSGTKWTVII
jgi:cysteinyl-tRNA synthetase